MTRIAVSQAAPQSPSQPINSSSCRGGSQRNKKRWKIWKRFWSKMWTAAEAWTRKCRGAAIHPGCWAIACPAVHVCQAGVAEPGRSIEITFRITLPTHCCMSRPLRKCHRMHCDRRQGGGAKVGHCLYGLCFAKAHETSLPHIQPFPVV